MRLRDLTAEEAGIAEGLWTRAMGDTFALRAGVLRLTIWDDPNFLMGDAIAAVDDQDVLGVAWLKRWRDPSAARGPFGSPGDPPLRAGTGYVGGIVVDPRYQRRGIGTALLRAIEKRLRQEGGERIEVSGGLLHLLPGLPDDAPAARAFFRRAGYVDEGTYWDVWQDLTRCELGAPDPRISVGRDGQALLEFLDREFSGGWAQHARWHLASGGTPSDFLVLDMGGRIEGFCQIVRPGAWPPGPSAYFNDGGLGPIGVTEAMRGQGLGKALLEAGLLELRRSGVRGCVIDWTTLLDFYGIFGFSPWRTYIRVAKPLAP